MASRSRSVPGSGSRSTSSSTRSMRAWQAATRAAKSAAGTRASFTAEPSLRRGGSRGRIVRGLLEGLDLCFGAALHEDLDLLLGRLERGLTLTGERDAALEGLQSLIERQVAVLEPLHQ